MSIDRFLSHIRSRPIFFYPSPIVTKNIIADMAMHMPMPMMMPMPMPMPMPMMAMSEPVRAEAPPVKSDDVMKAQLMTMMTMMMMNNMKQRAPLEREMTPPAMMAPPMMMGMDEGMAASMKAPCPHSMPLMSPMAA